MVRGKKFKEDEVMESGKKSSLGEELLLNSIPDHPSTDHESVEDLLMHSVYDADLFDYVKNSKRKRRDASEPMRQFQSLLCEKRYKEADSILLEDRSNSRLRQFKIFDDK